MSKLISIKRAGQGINTNPALSGKWDSPFLLENLEIDFSTGYWNTRKGYTKLEVQEILRTGEQIAKTYYLGIDGRPSYDIHFRYGIDQSYVVHGERLIVSGITKPKWHDMRALREYDLGTPQPSEPANYVIQLSLIHI